MSDPSLGGSAHIKNTLLRSLEHGTVDLPIGPNSAPVTFKLKELGIGYSILVREKVNRDQVLLNPNYAGPATSPGGVVVVPEVLHCFLVHLPGIGPDRPDAG